MIALAGLALLLIKAVTCEDPSVQVGQIHGNGNSGEVSIIVCPFGGAFTALHLRGGKRIDQVEFECTSSRGITRFGPYGGNGGDAKKLQCPDGQYIDYFYGKSGEKVDRLGFYCKPQTNTTVQNDGKDAGWVGGDGGQDFNDRALSVDYRIVSIKITSSDELLSIEVTYGTTSINGKLCAECNEFQEKWAPSHGGDGGDLSTVYCPAEGVITGIKYRAGFRLDSITFICTSAHGIYELGPFGRNGGNAGEENCPPGSYISSIHGRSDEKVDALGIRCRKVGQVGSSARRDAHGGTGGNPFDDLSFEENSYQPVQIRIRHGEEIDMIQIKYGNMPVSTMCKISKIEVTDKNIIAKDDNFAVIGLATGLTCSNQTQSLTLSYTAVVEENVEVVVYEGGESNWDTSVSMGVTTGVSFGVTFETSFEMTQSAGGSHSWSSTNSKSTSTGSESSIGSTVNYEGPGACLAIGVIKQYKIERDNVPVMYHYKCESGELNPIAGTIKLSSKTFGQASFLDYTHEFETEDECTNEARTCVSSIKANKIITDPKDIEMEFDKCFK